MATRTVPAATGGDDQTILQNTFSSAVAGDTIAFTSTAYKHSNTLAWPSATGVTMQATGVTLTATNPRYAALRITGTASNDAKIVGLKHVVTGASTRIDLGEDVAPFVLRQGVRRVTLEDTISDGSTGLAYFIYGAHDGLMTRVQAKNSLADAIHFTAGSSGWVLNDPYISNSGDDAIPFIGYQQDGESGRPHDNVVNRPIIRDTRARGVQCAGAYNITVYDLDCDGSLAAAVQFAVERGNFNTSDTTNCHVYRGRIARAGTAYAAIPGGTDGQPLDQGGVLWLASGSGSVVTNCTINDVATGNFGSVNYDTFRAISYGGTITGCSANRTTLYAGSPSTYVGGNTPSSINPQTSTNSRSTTMPAGATGPVTGGSGTPYVPPPTPAGPTVYDSCTRTSTTTPGITDTGHTWTPRIGTWGTTGTRLYSVSAADNDQVTLELGSTEQQVAARPYGVGTNKYPELLLRWSSTGTHYWAEATPDGKVSLLRRVNDTFTTLAATAAGVIADGALLAARVVEVSGGTQITAYLNGAQVITTLDTAGTRPMGTSMGLRHGAGAGSLSIQWDDIHATTLDSPLIAQKAAGWVTSGTSLAAAFPVAPATGARLLAFIAIDKTPGTITTPSGWTSFKPTSAPSLALVSLTRPANGSSTDRSLTLSWATAQGAQALLVEVGPSYTGSVGTLDTGSGSDDAAVAALSTAGATTVTSPGLAITYLAVDTGGTAFTTSGDPQWSSGVTRLHSNPGSTAGTNANGGVTLDAVMKVLASGDDPGAAATWGTADQAHMRTAIVAPAATSTATTGLRVRKSGAWVPAMTRKNGAWVAGPKTRKNGAWV